MDPRARAWISAMLGTLLALSAAVSAFAQVTLTGGSLSGGGVTFSSFTGVILDGTRQTTGASWSIADITDARGTGAGWHLALSLTQLKEYDASTGLYVLAGKTLPTASITVTAPPSVSATDGSSTPASEIAVIAAGTALNDGTTKKVLIADLNEGMGAYAITAMGVTLAVPANTYAKTYKTDAAVSLNSGP